ncbi:hypothetical protein LTR37_008565 [Vermiconidia calcicola]|uniref:Uncharacterized protein n=1 Tax=Vermiconidia calcicola TaxID=1690605 RepID=A0ACC3NAR7_9PEZI|nr:hypothetical protein LTR37_008565 [Vermiconidia calcicola]
MAPQAQDPPFRFLQLPPELRNKVYDYVFEDAAHYYIAIASLPVSSLQPSPSITFTCHLVRSESLPLYHEATARFWASHDFYFTYDFEKTYLTSAEVLDLYELQLKRLPQYFAICNLSFWSDVRLFEKAPRPLILTLTIALDSSFGPVWTSTIAPSTDIDPISWDAAMQSKEAMTQRLLNAADLDPEAVFKRRALDKRNVEAVIKAIRVVAS